MRLAASMALMPDGNPAEGIPTEGIPAEGNPPEGKPADCIPIIMFILARI